MPKSSRYGRKALAASLVIALSGGLGMALESSPAAAAGGGFPFPEQSWSFDGVFGTFDRAALQRGFQVYNEACSACHGLEYVAFRNLAALGYNDEQIKAFAAEKLIVDGPDDEGEMFEREGRPSDLFPSPFPNAQAAAASNNGAVPPDLSLMAKARAGGADYIYAILMGYQDSLPESVLQEIFDLRTAENEKKYKAALEEYEDRLDAYQDKIEDGQTATEPVKPEKPEPVTSVEDLGLPDTAHFNAYFAGFGIAMGQPLYGDDVEFADGTEATIEQQARDVAHFLTWAAEPTMEERKRSGIKVILFLIVLTALFYAVKRKVWADLH